MSNSYQLQAFETIKLLLENGMSAESASEIWGHIIFDLSNLDLGTFDDDEDGEYRNVCEQSMKKIMLCAAYDHILRADKDLQQIICCSRNDYDLHKFKAWNDFVYKSDTSKCDRKPEFYRSVVRIFEKESGREIWKMDILLSNEEY